MMIKHNGILIFEDSHKKFLAEKHALKNLIDDTDICVYSLTPKGESDPKYLIVKVMPAGSFDRSKERLGYSDATYTVMIIIDYETILPWHLFPITRALTSALRYNLLSKKAADFFVQDVQFMRRLTPEEFFSIEVDPNADDFGTKTYLRDKEIFLT